MRLFDTSHYCEQEKVENYLIEVLPVNKSVWITFFVKEGFSLALNSSNLRYNRVVDEEGLTPLPDGIYEIRQSFQPNSYTVAHYLHLRIADFNNKLLTEKANLQGDQCSLSREEYKKNRDKLRDIDEYIEAAKYMVEEQQDKAKGLELYQFAQKLLEQYSNECQC